ncbi:hypothetical protein PILCRDRAFT_811064 [Piloderma croceum F 1598]|uniref:Uncharacterized protein n=1 Tax=Piloderma croceum (strain F 1598) TaxID=765440 RepID=A0A0C3GMP3_PILCF|nr:hypothetical protein PILCRDRAFT_830169 [Piloderma croceum F 1598]KIM91801.1 hypothetical protein PILCRDRAFT_811064 [Piloderma croceum F 1598]
MSCSNNLLLFLPSIELSLSLETQHAAAQSTISDLESKVSSLESLVKQSQAPAAPQPDSLTQTLNDWTKIR